VFLEMVAGLGVRGSGMVFMPSDSRYSADEGGVRTAAILGKCDVDADLLRGCGGRTLGEAVAVALAGASTVAVAVTVPATALPDVDERLRFCDDGRTADSALAGGQPPMK